MAKKQPKVRIKQRINRTNEGSVREYKNHNLHIRFSPEAIEKIKADVWTDMEVISWILDGVDTDFIGDEYCLSNFDMGAMLYNRYSDRTYVISFADINTKLHAGKELILYASVPSEDDREAIRQQDEDDF